MHTDRNEPQQPWHFRRKPRPGRQVKVRFAVIDGTETGPAQFAETLNIGVGGAFIATDDPLPPGTRLVLGITVPAAGREREIEALGDVRWIADAEDDAVHGMGVRFHGLAEDELEILNGYFASLTPTVDYDEADGI